MDVLKREGGATATNDPLDPGGRTQYGISERSNPVVWADGKVTEEEARAIYQAKYITGPGFDNIADMKLRSLLVDYGVLSGPFIAIQALQRVVGVTPDGVIGPATLAALAAHVGNVVNGMVAERVKMIGRIVVRNPSQVKYLNGWLNRCLEWLI